MVVIQGLQTDENENTENDMARTRVTLATNTSGIQTRSRSSPTSAVAHGTDEPTYTATTTVTTATTSTPMTASTPDGTANPTSEPATMSNRNATTTTREPAPARDNTAALMNMIQQLMTTVGQIGQRLGDLETAQPETTPPPPTTAVPTTERRPTANSNAAEVSSAATTSTPTATTPTPIPTRQQTTTPAPTSLVTTDAVEAPAATATRRSRATRRPRDYGSPDDSSSSSSDDSNDGYSDDGRRRRRNRRRQRDREQRHRRSHRKNAKELDLQPFKPTAGGVRVETWIAKVDLAVEGARMSRRGEWTDEELYYVVGKKLLDDAAKTWVQINKELRREDRTWTKLKEALIRRYGERKDLAQAEWRVMQRTMEPGETFADFASGLRDAAGQNPVREETLIAQFYRGLRQTTRQLVKLDPAPTTLGEAVDKATRYEDPSYNVARGMRNIGQPWATPTTHGAIQVDGTTGMMRVIPGIGSMPISVTMNPTTDDDGNAADYACFTNPQGVFDKTTGVWEAPKGMAWNGKFWRPLKKERSRKARTAEHKHKSSKHAGKNERKMKVMKLAPETEDESSSSEESETPRRNRRNGNATRRATSEAADSGKRRTGVVEGELRPVQPTISQVITTDIAETTRDEKECSATPPAQRQELVTDGGGSVLREANEQRDGDVRNEQSDDQLRATVVAMLTKSVVEKDEARAKRYVETVKPAMAASRYDPETDEERRRTRRLSSGEGGGTHEGGRRSDEEGGAADAVTPTLLATTTSLTTTSTSIPSATTTASALKRPATHDMQLGEQSVPDSESVAQVRLMRKQAKREAKRQRVERAEQRAAAVVPVMSDEVERTVIELDEADRARRQQQADEAWKDLEIKRERRWLEAQTQVQRDEQCARVSLVQRRGIAAVNVARGAGIEADDGLPTATMEVDGEGYAVKWDSCARYSVAGTDWMERGERVRGPAPVDYVEGVGGFLLDVIGVWQFEMRNVFGQVVCVKACIVEGCTNEFLVGVDFMKAHKANMDFDKNEVRYYDKNTLVVVPFRTEDSGGGCTKIAAVRLVRRVKLTRNAVTPLTIMIAAPDGEQGIFVPTQPCGAVLLATTMTKVMSGKALVPAINLNGDRVKLPAKKELGVWIPLAKDMQALELNGELETNRVTEWLESLGDTETPLDNEQEVRIGETDPNIRDMVIKLLRAYRDVSVNNGDCPPMTTLDVQHHIDTGDTAPIMLKRRRQAQTEDVVIDDNVTKMLQAGVIETGNGAWGFPVVLVRKKDGEVRFCIDYRALNKVTKRDVYPLPRIDETLDAMHGAQLFTTLDLRSGYWQIGVAPEDRDKTAFTTKQGLFRFTRMPFGLMNAPSTFQRMMNGVLRGLTWLTCLVYLDDIVIFTRGGIEQHIVQLASVLERLAAVGLTLKLKKCVFATRTMEYLGHELSSSGVRPVERLIKAVSEFPRPRDPVEVKRFVHLAGYYRKFIEAFGSMMAPMTKLLRKDCPWEWTEDQQFAFERVKAILTTKPLLIYPDFKLPFRLVTDASKVGLGACLMQDQGHGWQPIAYASKVNNHAESNYSITELECLAVVWSVKLFRPYLYGRVFEIVTDHAALKWLMRRTNPAGRLHRWSLTLQEYEFEITYSPGTTNVVADALSRAPTTSTTTTAAKATTAAVLAIVKASAVPPQQQSNRQARQQPDSEPKTEEDEPPTEEARQAAERTEQIAAATASQTTTPTVKIPMSKTAAIRKPRTTAELTAATIRTPGADGVIGRTTQNETTRPRTRLARKREEEAAQAAARAAESTSLAATEAIPATTSVESTRTTRTETQDAARMEDATVVATTEATRPTTEALESREMHQEDKAFAGSEPVTTYRTTTPNATPTSAATTTTTGATGARTTTTGAMGEKDETTRTDVPRTPRVTTDVQDGGNTGVTTEPGDATTIAETARVSDTTSQRTVSEPGRAVPRSTATTKKKTRPTRIKPATRKRKRVTWAEPLMPDSTTEAPTKSTSPAIARRTSTEATTTNSIAEPVETKKAEAATVAQSEWSLKRGGEKTIETTKLTTGRAETKMADTATAGRSEWSSKRDQYKTTKTKTKPRRVAKSVAVHEPNAQTPKTDMNMKSKTRTKAKPTTRTKAKVMPPRDDETHRTSDMMSGNEDEMEQEPDSTLQLTDTEIIQAQQRSRLVQRILAAGNYQDMKVTRMFGLVTIESPQGTRVILPPTLWPVVFKELHDSIWSGHLRGPHTYARVAQAYWWPGLHREVNQWVRGCQECGSRKAKPREVIPPLRSLRGGDVGDRWALDVAGPFPVSTGGERYVIAALEYVTRYAVASSVTHHTAERVATFLMEDVVLRFGAFRELLTDGAPEMTGRVIEQLVDLLQSKQTNPVPYRPQMIGLVERFHRSWKNCVATFMYSDQQNDWSDWVACAVYSYNSAQHSTVKLSPNELMMGRTLRPPNELLRRSEQKEAGDLMQYHERLLKAMQRGYECAEQARKREQARQARYYNRKVRKRRTFESGDRVWVYNPPRGPKATKFVHQWMGPMCIIEPAGYDNYLLRREDKNGRPETMIAHASFLVSYHSPTSLLRQAAIDISEQLEHEDECARPVDVETTRAIVSAAKATSGAGKRTGTPKRRRNAASGEDRIEHDGPKLVELRRRKRRNSAGQYPLEYELRPTGAGWTRTTDAGMWTTDEGRLTARWVGQDEYERLYSARRVVEDSGVEEGV